MGHKIAESTGRIGMRRVRSPPGTRNPGAGTSGERAVTPEAALPHLRQRLNQLRQPAGRVGNCPHCVFAYFSLTSSFLFLGLQVIHLFSMNVLVSCWSFRFGTLRACPLRGTSWAIPCSSLKFNRMAKQSSSSSKGGLPDRPWENSTAPGSSLLLFSDPGRSRLTCASSLERTHME